MIDWPPVVLLGCRGRWATRQCARRLFQLFLSQTSAVWRFHSTLFRAREIPCAWTFTITANDDNWCLVNAVDGRLGCARSFLFFALRLLWLFFSQTSAAWRLHSTLFVSVWLEPVSVLGLSLQLFFSACAVFVDHRVYCNMVYFC